MKRIWKKGILQSWSYGARCRTLCPGQSFSMDKSPGCTRVTGMPASGFQTSKPGHESVNPVHTAPTCLEHFSITGFPVSAFPLQFSTASSTLEISVGQFCGERGREVWYKCVVSQEWCVPLTIICWPSDFFRLGLQSQDPLFFLESKEFLAPPSSTFHNFPPFFCCQ